MPLEGSGVTQEHPNRNSLPFVENILGYSGRFEGKRSKRIILKFPNGKALILRGELQSTALSLVSEKQQKGEELTFENFVRRVYNLSEGQPLHAYHEVAKARSFISTVNKKIEPEGWELAVVPGRISGRKVIKNIIFLPTSNPQNCPIDEAREEKRTHETENEPEIPSVIEMEANKIGRRLKMFTLRVPGKKDMLMQGEVAEKALTLISFYQKENNELTLDDLADMMYPVEKVGLRREEAKIPNAFGVIISINHRLVNSGWKIAIETKFTKTEKGTLPRLVKFVQTKEQA